MPRQWHYSDSEPSVTIGILRIWVHNRRGDWLWVTAECHSAHSKIHVSGEYLHLVELTQWRDSVMALHAAQSGESKLDPAEPHIGVTISIEDGACWADITLTEDPMEELHRYLAEIDSSVMPGLPELVRDLDEVLRKYPMHGEGYE